jgi:putative aldouronate transport system substrate-binding protein
VYPIAKEHITIRVGIPQWAQVEDYKTNAFTKFFEEKGNFTLEFELFPTAIAEARQLVAVRVAGGATLPDVLVGFDFSEDVILNMAREGAIIPLNEYYKNWAHYFPQQLETLSNKRAWQWMHSADGNIYYLPWIQEQVGNHYALRGWINQTWLDNLGLAMPSTTDEFRAVLQAFAARNPARSNTLVIPAVGNTDNPRGKIVDFLLNAFIYNDVRDRLILDQNGRVDVIFNKPEYREGLRYVSSLFRQGLILNQSFTLNSAGLRGIVESGEESTVGFFGAGFANALSPNNTRRMEYVPMPPLTGPQGTSYAPYFPDIPAKMFLITSSARHPEAIFRWGDLMTSLDTSIWARFGVPGVDWREALPNEKSMYDSLGMPATLAQILPWGGMQNSHWYTRNPGILPLGIVDGQVAPDNPFDNEHWVARAVPLYIGKESPRRVEHTIFTLEETRRIADIKNSINTYVNEAQALFAIGDLSLDTDWDSYVRELEQIGLRRYLEVVQAGYDRAMGNN